MMLQRLLSLMIGLLLLSGAAAPAALAQSSPQAQLQEAVSEGLEVLKEPGLSDEQRIARLRKVVYPMFNFPEMAKRSLGSHWRKRTPEQQAEFTRLFTNLLEQTYAKQIASYDGQRVVYAGEKIDGKYAQVDTRIIDKTGREFQLDYRMLKDGDRWLVYDVVIENISLVNNYRAQFNRVITRNSYDQLVDKMRSRAS